jgi:hypothetical protein
LKIFPIVFFYLFFIPHQALADVTSFNIESTREIRLNSNLSYELIKGKLFFEIDPDDPDNLIITDIIFTPRNDRGLVEFAADFELLRPLNKDHSNDVLIADILNRGSRRAIRYFNFATNYDTSEGPSNLGDEFLMNNGYSVLSVGWQFDVPNNASLLRSYLPVIGLDNEQASKGIVRSDFSVTQAQGRHTLGDRSHFAYPVAKEYSELAQITQRDRYTNNREVIDSNQWNFINDSNESNQSYLSDPDDFNAVTLEGGFQPDKVYEITYYGDRTVPAGLGLAAIRDANLFIKSNLYFDQQDTKEDPLVIIAFGDSQSGRTLRTYLYDGFNVSNGQMVFDGAMIHLGANARGGFNQRFTQSSRAVDQNYDYPADQFPFSDNPSEDDYSDEFSGLLDAYSDQQRPKIFYSNSSTEYWRSPAYLLHTTINGSKDLDPLASSRIFQFSGTQHVPSSGMSFNRTNTMIYGNNAKYQWFLRALLIGMKDWVISDIEPPESRYPRVDRQSLTLAENIEMPPGIGITINSNLNHGYLLNYGDLFKGNGIPNVEPPARQERFSLMVSSIDHNGNEFGGLLPWEVAVPLATYTGWFPGNPKSSIGMIVPFETSQDSSGRDTISVLYNSKADYVSQVSAYVDEMVSQRYLLDQDKLDIIREADNLWNILVAKEM